MIANLLLKVSPENNFRKVRTIPIFDDCIVCGEVRDTKKKILVHIKNRCDQVTIIACDCACSIPHQELIHEGELLEILDSIGIRIDS